MALDESGRPADASVQARFATTDGSKESTPISPQDGLRLSRRALLAAAAAATLASCAPPVAERSIKPAPFKLGRPATLYVDGTIPPELARVAPQFLNGVAGISSVAPVSAGEQADCILTYGALPDGYSSAAVWSSPATILTHLRVPIDGVTASEVRGLLSGYINDWHAVGSPYTLGVHVLTLAGLPPLANVPIAAGARSITGTSKLLAALRRQPGSLALVPVELADWSVRNLGVDGVYPAQGRGDLSNPALPPFAAKLGVSQALVAKGFDLKQVQQRVEHFGALLGIGTETVDMVVVGDIMLGRGVNNKMVAYHDYLYPYRKIHDEFMNADLRVANLECTVTDLVPVPTDPGTFTFVSAKKAVEGLVFAGLHIVTVANNHANGPGAPGFLDMLNSLRARGISTCGGGHNLAEARKPAIRAVKGRRIAILGYDIIAPQGPFATNNSPGIAPVDLDTLPADLAAARTKADLVIPYFHWGHEYENDPGPMQQHIAHAAIDAGADMVLGNHPHWVQGIESYKGRLIIYSFGNFIFDQDWSRETMEGMMVHLYWRGTTLASIRFVPVLDQDRCQPRMLTPAEAVGVFTRMWSGTDLLANGQYGPDP